MPKPNLMQIHTSIIKNTFPWDFHAESASEQLIPYEVLDIF